MQARQIAAQHDISVAVIGFTVMKKASKADFDTRQVVKRKLLMPGKKTPDVLYNACFYEATGGAAEQVISHPAVCLMCSSTVNTAIDAVFEQRKVCH